MGEPIDSAGAALRGTLRTDEPMRRHVSWRAGGAAARAYFPADAADLAVFLRTLPAGEPVCFAGLGSNLLVRDGGFRGTVVMMHAMRAGIALERGRVVADAGAASARVARFAATHAFAGAEFLAGIPGTVGGALAMNAGCYGGQTWDCVEKVQTIRRDGSLRLRARAEFAIGYRAVSLPGSALGDQEWFAAAWFHFPPGDAARARARIRELLRHRVATQPIDLPNAGSVFRNPPGDHAGRLIEACGLKGFSIGGARISDRHANFIVNPQREASATDIEALIETVRRSVRERFGVALETEVRIVGEAIR